jgi:hypothetical protein
MSRLLVITELFLPTKGGTAVWAAEVYKRLGGKESTSSPPTFRAPPKSTPRTRIPSTESTFVACRGCGPSHWRSISDCSRRRCG